MSFQEYKNYITDSVKEETIKRNMSKIVPVGHFKIEDDATYKACHYPGYTLITPTFGDDNINSDTYNTLISAQKMISEIIPRQKCVKAPEEALHMTVARLISGEMYINNIQNIKETEVLDAFGKAFSGIGKLPVLDFEIKGISVLKQGVIAAMVTTEDENSYKALQLFRDAVYSDERLCAFGVERKRGFIGHITMLYIEKELFTEEKATIAETVSSINSEHFSKPVPFFVKRAELRKFGNYLSFYREKNWPAFSFGA